jgi:hypothetical protein
VDNFAPQLCDVLPAIFAQLLNKDKPAFLLALCVCCECADAGFWLWWHRVCIDLLVRITNISRRQFYADHIQDFEMWHSFWGPRAFAAADVL